ncbi:Cytochrome c5 [gamma proteobacterium IMCC2047]|nr:Cytochrome c5 [gamma proteobacterium IMCC2047]
MSSSNNNVLTKTLAVVASLVAGVFFTGAVLAESSLEDEIRERIKPVGEVCISGEDCGDIAAPVAAAPAGPRSGEDIYKTTCFGCHGTGAAGAPKLGDSAAWSARTGKGLDAVISNAINGINAMPPRGTCASCSDDDIAAAVNYMVDNSK